jgi:hypothetical protein
MGHLIEVNHVRLDVVGHLRLVIVVGGAAVEEVDLTYFPISSSSYLQIQLYILSKFEYVSRLSKFN